jgi:Retrotransposon gag protein/Zinc knuckle
MATQTITTTAATTTVRPSTPPIDATPTTQTATSPSQRIEGRLQTALQRAPGGPSGSGGSGNPGGPGGPGDPDGPGQPGGNPVAPVTPAAPTQPANHDDRLMGSLPQAYEGDRKLARTFLDQLTHYFRANSRVPGLNSAIRKVSIALTLFQGQQTAAWVRDMGVWIDSLDPVNDDIPEVWTTFIQEFNDHFADSQSQQRARLQLDQCKMRFPDVDQYISDFEDLVRQAGYTVSNEETIGFFLNGLSPSILDEVVKIPLPQHYDEYKARAVNITKGRQMIELIRARRGLPNPRGFNNNQGQFRPRAWGGRPQQNQQRPPQQQQRPQYNSTNAPRPAYNNVQVPMDLSRTRAPYNRRQYQNNAYSNTTQTDYNRVADVPVQQDYRPRRPKGPCFNCGKMGHFAKDCRSGTSASINYMDTIDEDMQNVPQPSIAPRHDVNRLVAEIDALSKDDQDSLIEAMGSSQDFLPA